MYIYIRSRQKSKKNILDRKKNIIINKKNQKPKSITKYKNQKWIVALHEEAYLPSDITRILYAVL